VLLTALVLADTHLRDGDRKWLPPSVLEHLAAADVVLHAGDVVEPGALQRIRDATPAPVHAVLGNNDTRLDLPDHLELELAGVAVGLIHDSGPAAGRERRMRRRFPGCQVVVFGHSHIPIDAEGVDGQRLFNPGSPTVRRRQPVGTFGVLRLADGRLADHLILPVEPPPAPAGRGVGG
jgi:hypothetical protein